MSMTDEQAIDAIATLLGTAPEWESPADYLETIANVIGQVRPHPGDKDPLEYAREFRAATNRDVIPAYASEVYFEDLDAAAEADAQEEDN